MPFVLASIFFGNPALWVGAAALVIPIAIHLLTRRTPRKILFPTLTFLRQAVSRQSNFYRIRHPLLLLARTLLLLLILLAFLKPILSYSAARSTQDPASARTQIILLDASASMGYSAAGVTPANQARAAVLDILEKHRAGDRLNLIQMGATPQCCFDEPMDNVFFLRKDLKAFVPTQTHADINGALAEAARQLEGISGSRKQIFLVSDFQRTNWSSVDFATVGQDTELFFVPTQTLKPANVALTDVSVRPTRPTVAEAVQIICRVANYSDQAQRLPLRLHFREGETLEQEVTLAPYSSVSVDFSLRFRREGAYEGQVTIPADDLALDDRRHFTLTVSDKVNTLLVSDQQRGESAGGQRFLRRAINPFARDQQALAVVTQIRSQQIKPYHLAQAQVVFLAEIDELAPTAADALMAYLRDGGSVVYFHVGGAGSLNLARLVAASEGDFVLPYEITGQVALAANEAANSLTEANFDHAILRKFKESGQLGDIRFYQYFRNKRVEQRGQVLLRYEDGNIAMAQATVGAGTLLLCNFGCSLEQSDLAKHTLFVPLIHEMIKALRPGLGVGNGFTVGEQCYTTLPAISPESQLAFRDPDDRSLQASIDMGAQGTAVFFPQTDRCGFYRVLVDGQIAGSMAVNLDPLESNLERLDAAQIEQWARTSHKVAVALAAGSAGIERALTGKPLWPYCLIGAIGLLCLEQILTLVCRH